MKGLKSPQMREVWIMGELEDDKTVYDDSVTVENHLLERNAKHLQQAQHTPFANGDKAIYLGEHGNSDFTERVLHSQPLPELNDVDPIMRAYVEGLAYSNVEIPDSVDTTLSLE